MARANGLPNASIAISNAYNPSPISVQFGGTPISLSPIFGSTASLTVTQPVYPLSRWRAPIASACAGVGISEETLERTRQQVMFQTRQAVFQVLSAEELLGVDQEAVNVAKQQLQLAQNTVNAGLAAPLDIFQAQAVLADAQVTLTQQQNTLDVANAVLATQIGVPAGTVVSLVAPKTLPAATPDVDGLVEQALRDRPELASYNCRRQQILAAMAITRLQRQVLINLAASYSEPITGASVIAASGASLGLNIAYTLFDGGATSAELRQERVQLSQVDTQARQTELTVTLEVRQAWLDLQNALQQLTDAEAQRVAAAEALRIAEVRYANGEGIVLEVEQARLKLTQALTSLAQARYQAQVADAQLSYALGCPAPAVPTPTLPPTPLIPPR